MASARRAAGIPTRQEYNAAIRTVAVARPQGSRERLPAEEYDRLWNAQGGRCAICKIDLGLGAAVDHDHATGAIRGLLCIHCNFGLGRFKDDPVVLRAAARYLTRS